MFKKILLVIYTLIFFNNNSFAEENKNILRVGLLAPFSGQYKDMGQSIMLSLQLALKEINDDEIIIYPRDSGFNNKDKLLNAIDSLRQEKVKVVIGPTNFNDFNYLSNYRDMIFISPSNTNPKIQDNVLSIGVSLESQITAIENFLNKSGKKKTIIMFPKNKFENLIESKLKDLKLKNYKIFKYNPDPKILTNEIEKLTNYKQRKRNLISRVKILEKKDDEASKIELKRLEQKYTIGKVNFDSIIIIDFADSLKSVLTSLVYSDVNQKDVLITTVNQWFDKSIFLENSIKELYYPSINLKNFDKYREKFSKTYGSQPSEITILTYDALGLIYYIWNKNKFKINSVKDFLVKDKIKGKIGVFSISNGEFTQELEIYKASNKKFIKF